MFRILLTLVALFCLSGAASAQTPPLVKPCVTTSASSCPPVSATTPLPVTGSFTPSGTQDVNVKQVGGSNVAAGVLTVTGGTPVRVAPTWTVQNAAYSSGNSLGGLLTISAGTTGYLLNVRITDKHSDVTPTMTVFVYDTNPTGVGSFACTDKAAYVTDPGVIHYQVFTPQNLTLAVPTGATYSYASVDLVPPRATVGATLYACVVVQGSITPNSTSDFYMDVGLAPK